MGARVEPGRAGGYVNLEGYPEPSSATQVADTIIELGDRFKGPIRTLHVLESGGRLARGVEGVMGELKSSSGGITVGTLSLLNTFSIIGGLIAAINIFVNTPKMIRKVREGREGWVHHKDIFENLGFWLRRIADFIAFIQWLESHQFYTLGSAATPILYVKLFSDTIGSCFGICHMLIEISDAHSEMAKLHKTQEKFQLRIDNGWDIQKIRDHANKLKLKNHLIFLQETLKITKEENVYNDHVRDVEKEIDTIACNLFMHKIDKLNALHPEAERSDKEYMSKVKRKLKGAKLSPEKQAAVQEVIDNREAHPNIREGLNGLRGKGFGVNYPSLTAKANQIWEGMELPPSKYNLTRKKAQDVEDSWNAMVWAHEQNDESAKPYLTQYCRDKIREGKFRSEEQNKLINRSWVSIAFSVGIIALGILGLVLLFSPGLSRLPFLEARLPYILATLAITVSIIGLAKFFVDELMKVSDVDPIQLGHGEYVERYRRARMN